MKKSGKLLLTLLLLIALAAAAAFVVMDRHANSVRMREEAAAEEEAKAKAEEEARAKAEAEAAEAARREELARERSEWYLILVNPDNAIPDDFEVKTVEVENGYFVDERIKDALSEMLADCRDAGYSPVIISSFRTRETQQYLYDHTANKADTAVPGHSEHECGLAADIIDADSMGWSDPLIDKQEDMPAQKWLMEHCSDYGFILRYPKGKQEKTGIIYEPWHYRYVGKDHAKIIMDKGLCLEEYLEDMGE